MESDQRLTPLPVLSAKLSPADNLPTYSSYDDALENRRSLRKYFNIVYKRLPLILAITIVVTVAAAFYSFRQPAIYQAQVRVVIEPRKPQLTLKDAVSINLADDQKYYKTQVELLQDPELMKRVVIALGLHTQPDLFKGRGTDLVGSVRSLFPSSQKVTGADSQLPIINDPSKTGNDPTLQLSPEENARAKNYAKILMQGFSVEQVNGTNIFSVNVQDSDPDLAEKVAYKLAETFIDEDANLETAGAQKAYENLGNSIEELRSTIATQEAALIDYMRSSGLPLQEKGQDLSADRLGKISETWLRAMESRRQLEARYNAATAASAHGQGTNMPDLYENKIFQDTMRQVSDRRSKLQDRIREIEKEIKEAETQRAELLEIYTPEYKKVREMDQRIASFKRAQQEAEAEVSKVVDLDQKKIEKEAISGALVSLRSQLDAAKTQEADARAAYDEEASRANVQGQAETKLITLKRGIDTNRSLLDTYTQREKEQELALSTGRPDNIKIQNRPIAPDEPIGPHRTRNIFIAFLLSIAAGVGLAFLLDHLDDSIRSSEDISRHLNLPTLAVIPHYVSPERAVADLHVTANGTGNASIATLMERNSPMAEAYRHLRTSLHFSGAGEPPRTILVTSAGPAEGKTTTAVNTAITLAQFEADTVIIDCDLRRPRLHGHFGLKNTRGLTNYLSGDTGITSMLQSCENLDRLKVITSGPIPPNPAELLSSNRMRDLLQALSARFKHVVLDSPPAISFADASILSTLVDGVVLVAMAESSSLHLLKQLKQRAENIGAHLYGVVLNDLKAGSTEYYNYDAGYYSYYSQSDDETEVLMDEHALPGHETHDETRL